MCRCALWLDGKCEGSRSGGSLGRQGWVISSPRPSISVSSPFYLAASHRHPAAIRHQTGLFHTKKERNGKGAGGGMSRDGTGWDCTRRASRWARCGSGATLTRRGRDTRSSEGWFLRRCREGDGGEEGGEVVGGGSGRAGRWIYKTEEWSREGTKETDGWTEESGRFTDGRRQRDAHVKATCAPGPSVLTRPCPQQTPPPPFPNGVSG